MAITVDDPNDDEIYAQYNFYNPLGQLYFIRENQPDFNNNNNIAIFDYDDNGNRSQLNYALKGSEGGGQLYIDYTYNHDNLLTAFETSTYGTSGNLDEFSLAQVTIDGSGRLTDADETLTKTNGSTITHVLDYIYDMRSQLTDASVTNIDSSTWTADFTYKKAGNIQTKEINSTTTDYTYTGDLMTEVDEDEIGWDLNGNMETGLTAEITWDWDNRLRSADVGSDGIERKYSPDGAMIYKESTENSTTTRRKYIIDNTDEYPVVLMEPAPDNSNAIEKTYLFSNSQILVQYDGCMSTGDKYFYLADRLGSVRQVIDVNADVNHLYPYGPFGKKLEDDDDETVDVAYQFASYVWDNILKQNYLNARWYDPDIYRFTGRDPLHGDFNEPATLHAYLYCLNNPTNLTDPTGEFTTEEVPTTNAIGSGLGGSGGYPSMGLLERVRFFTNLVGQRNWIYGKTIYKGASNGNINKWTKAMNAIGKESTIFDWSERGNNFFSLFMIRSYALSGCPVWFIFRHDF